MPNTPPLDLYALQTFVAFCEAGSMTLAANRLGVSQSAVSQLVKRLELDLACALLDRDLRPAQLTNAGRTLLELSRELLSHANTVAERVRQGALQGHPRIRLGCVDSFAATVGPALVRALSGDASELHLGSGLTPDLLDQLLSRQLDLAICTDAASGQLRLNQTSLFAERFVLVLPLDNVAEALPALSDLAARLPLIRYSLRSVIGQQVERWLRHVGLQSERRFEFDAQSGGRRAGLGRQHAAVPMAIASFHRAGGGVSVAGQSLGAARFLFVGTSRRVVAAGRRGGTRHTPSDATKHHARHPARPANARGRCL